MPQTASAAACVQRHICVLLTPNCRAASRLAEWIVSSGNRVGSVDPAIVVLIQQERETQAESLTRLQSYRQLFPRVPVLFVAQEASESLAVAVFRTGAADYLRWPATEAEFLASVSRLLPASAAQGRSSDLVGGSAQMQRLRERLYNLAAKPCSVLLTGETGTGKEVAARMLHVNSRRAHGPLVALNCAAVPEALLEAELFGFEKGSFTGASCASKGKFGTAHGGTLFLDEIGEMSFAMQAKLLRALEHREIQRLGASKGEMIDVRWIAATNRDLGEMVAEGRFRADLYYRLNVAEVLMPCLRDHLEDLELLVEHFIRSFSQDYGWERATFSRPAFDKLRCHHWPGNVRELRNVVESSLIRANGGQVEPVALPACLNKPSVANLAPAPDTERLQIAEALRLARGNKSKAAAMLQCSRMTLYRRMARCRLPVTPSDTDVTDGL